MNPPTRSRLALFWICLALSLATAFAYWPVRHHEFIGFDDDLYVTSNHLVQQGLTSEGIAWAFTSTTAASNWHPLTWLSHMLDVQLFGLNPGGHHMVSVFFHIANTLLLFLLLRKMTGALWRSAMVAALFALHPLHVESVAWVAERKDVLSGFLFFLTLWAYAHYAKLKNDKAARSSDSPGPAFPLSHSLTFYFLSLFFFSLGLMSKPMLVTLPFVLLLLDYWPLKRVSSQLWPLDSRLWTRLLLEKIPFFALTIASSIVTYVAQRNYGAVATFEQMTLAHRIGNAVVSYARYLVKTLWPEELVILYPLQVWPAWAIALSAILVLALSIAAVRMAQRRPYFLIGWLCYLGMLVPVIGLVHVGSQSMADRYTYLPLLGIFIALAWGLFDLFRSRKIFLVAALLVSGVLLLLTRAQVAHWRDSETLFSHALRHTQNNVLVLNNLASDLIAQRRFDEAIVMLNELELIQPNFPNLYINRGAALERQGQIDEAMSNYQRAIELGSKNPEAENNLGFLLLMRGDPEQAQRHFENALRVRPHFAQPHYNLGNIAFLKNDLDQALQHYQLAVRYHADYAEAHSNLGYTFFKLGQPDQALLHLEKAVRLKPDYAQAHNNLAETYLRLNRFADAERQVRFAVESNRDSPVFLNTLGMTLAAQRKWDPASDAFSRALELKPTAELHFRFANSLLALGRVHDAKAQYIAALELESNFPEAEMQLAMLYLRERNNAEAIAHFRRVAEQRPQWKEPINNLAWLLATSADSNLRNATESLDWALQAMRVSATNDFSALDTLAAAYAESGQFDKAQRHAEKAVQSARAAGDTNSAAQITARLELYRQSQPYRE